MSTIICDSTHGKFIDHCEHSEGRQTRSVPKKTNCQKPDRIEREVYRCCRCGHERLTIPHYGMFDR